MTNVLAVFAHAGDETHLAGGLIAELAATGYTVHLLCLAPGNQEMERSLRTASAELGISSVSTLRYRPSPQWPDESAGRVEQETSEAGGLESLSLSLTTAPPGDLAARIQGRLAELDPAIVITHSFHGDSGHPDHNAVNRATTSAFDSCTSNSAKKLYALAWPASLVRLNARLLGIGGRDIRRMGPERRFNLSAAIQSGRNDGPVRKFKVGDMLELRRRASVHYGGVISSVPLQLRLFERAPLWVQKWFLRTAMLTLLKESSSDGDDEIALEEIL